jgi:excisionase family DNA binding protein
MDKAEQSPEALLPQKVSPTGKDMRTAETIINRSVATATALAENMVAEALASLATMGVKPPQITLYTFMGFMAKLQVAKLSAIGMLRRDRLVLPRTACIKEFLKDNPGTANAADYLNIAYFLDVSRYMMRHFLPTRVLMSMALKPGAVEGLAVDEFAAPAPYSTEAKECAAAMNSVPYAAVKTRPIAFEPTSVGDLRKEASLTVDEAARVMRVSRKTLEDMCRDGRTPSAVYIRYAKTGNYHFITKKFFAWVENSEERMGKKRRWPA